MQYQYFWRKQASDAWLRENESNLLARFGQCVALIERPGKKQTTVEINCSTCSDVAALKKNFGGKIVRVSSAIAVTRTKPLKIGVRLVVTDRRSRAYFIDRRELIIPASGAFGTGEHATTAMCLRMLERISRRRKSGWSMLDAGTGSGILALAARCFGAKDVCAIDDDPRAIAIAKSNARLNRIRGIRFEVADVKMFSPRSKVDVIAANLFSELLIAAIPKWIPVLRSRGILILSGVLRSQERDVIRALQGQRLSTKETRRRGKWVALRSGEQKAG